MKKMFLMMILFMYIVGSASNAKINMMSNIDKEEQACIAKTADTQVMYKCSDIAQKDWEKEIVKTLSELKKSVSKENFENLIKSQQAWEQYKNDEFNSIDKMLSNKKGTMYINVAKGLKVDIVKQRALTLNEYLKTVND